MIDLEGFLIRLRNSLEADIGEGPLTRADVDHIQDVALEILSRIRNEEVE